MNREMAEMILVVAEALSETIPFRNRTEEQQALLESAEEVADYAKLVLRGLPERDAA